MKIAISSIGKELDSRVESRMGRAPYFIIYDLDKDSYQARENPFAQALHGAGVQAATFLHQEGVTAVLTGAVGPHATSVFKEAGITVYTGISSTVREAIQALREGRLRCQ